MAYTATVLMCGGYFIITYNIIDCWCQRDIRPILLNVPSLHEMSKYYKTNRPTVLHLPNLSKLTLSASQAGDWQYTLDHLLPEHGLFLACIVVGRWGVNEYQLIVTFFIAYDIFTIAGCEIMSLEITYHLPTIVSFYQDTLLRLTTFPISSPWPE